MGPRRWSCGDPCPRGVIAPSKENPLHLLGIRKPNPLASGKYLPQRVLSDSQQKAVTALSLSNHIPLPNSTIFGFVKPQNNTLTNWSLNANYKSQGEQSLRDDIVMLSMLKGRT